MKVFRNIILGLLCFFLIMWIGALIRCEVLTRQHYDEFKDAYMENTMLGDMEYFKVLRYRPYRTDIAQVYYVYELYKQNKTYWMNETGISRGVAL